MSRIALNAGAYTARSVIASAQRSVNLFSVNLFGGILSCMTRRRDLAGQRFGKWRVLDYATDRRWHCQCDCGTRRLVFAGSLTSGSSASCGCTIGPAARLIRTKHGQAGSKLHMIWKTMRQRCLNPANRKYHCYGGRGIRICDRWQEFLGFLQDMGPTWQDGLSIERIDVNGHYDPGNCIWIPLADQAKNRRPRSEWVNPCA